MDGSVHDWKQVEQPHTGYCFWRRHLCSYPHQSLGATHKVQRRGFLLITYCGLRSVISVMPLINEDWLVDQIIGYCLVAYMGVNNLPKVVTRLRGGRRSNSRPLSHQPDPLATRLSSHHPVDQFIQVLGLPPPCNKLYELICDMHRAAIYRMGLYNWTVSSVQQKFHT